MKGREEDMIVSAIGDSLTEGDYGIFGKKCIANVQEKNYPYFLAWQSGWEVRNFGFCGKNASSYLEEYQKGKVRVEGSDVIVVMLGTNGGLSPREETQGNRDYAALLSYLHRDAPNAKICLCAPPHATENPACSNYGYAEQVRDAAEFVTAYAEKHGYPLIDIYHSGLFTAENEAVMQPNDGLHLSEIGYKTLADYIFRYIEERTR